MRGSPGPEAKARLEKRERQRARDGWVNVEAAAALAERPAATIQAWIAAGDLGCVVLDHRRYVSRAAVKTLAKARRAFARARSA